VSRKLDRVHKLTKDFDDKTSEFKAACPNKANQDKKDKCWENYQKYKERVYTRMEDASEDMKKAARDLFVTSKSKLSSFIGKLIDVQLKAEKHLGVVNKWIDVLKEDSSPGASTQMAQAKTQATSLKNTARAVSVLEEDAKQMLLSIEANNKYGKMCFRFDDATTYIDIKDNDMVELFELTLKMFMEILFASHGDGGEVDSVTLSDQLFSPNAGLLRRSLLRSANPARGSFSVETVAGIDCNNCETDDPTSDAFGRRMLAKEIARNLASSSTTDDNDWDPKILEMLTLSMQRTFPDIMGDITKSSVVSCSIFE